MGRQQPRFDHVREIVRAIQHETAFPAVTFVATLMLRLEYMAYQGGVAATDALYVANLAGRWRGVPKPPIAEGGAWPGRAERRPRLVA